MQTKKENVSLDNICNGEVIERFNQLLEQAFKNCMDLNYDESPRKIKLEVEIRPNDRRDEVVAIAKFTPTDGKLTTKPAAMAIGIGQDGRAVAREYVSQQQQLFEVNVTQIRPNMAPGMKGE